jgi:cytidine deaminase
VDTRALLEAAWSARARAHAPYSRFQVGAALITSDGRIFSGCNVENASYPCGSCAEATAVVKAVSEGALKPGGLEAVLVATDTREPTPPCGRCRQIIEEFANDDTKVLLSTNPEKVDEVIEHKALLPASFGRGNLNKKAGKP